MKRSFLRWFYVAVQFVMLAVSIPKVATLFHAYDPQTMGPPIAGLDARSWLVGIAIDLCAAFTTWAAMAKYEESRKRTALLAPGLIILFCTALSVIANYEDAATLRPEQYANVDLFTHPALLINPVLISAPPVLVLLLILLVPSVLARPRLKSAEEIEAEANEAEAKILAQARVREAKAKANASVRGAQLKGLLANVQQARGKPEQPEEQPPEPPPPFAPIILPKPPTDFSESGVFALPALPQLPAKVNQAMWKSMSLKQRVLQSGIISPQEVAEVLDLSVSHGRNLTKGIEPGEKVPGRTGVPYQALIESLYEKRTKDSFAYAQKLETALGVKKKYARHLQAVPDQPDQPEAPDEELESEA